MGKKIKSLICISWNCRRGQFNDLAGTAVISDNEILVADKFTHRIQMCTLTTLKGRFMTSVRQFVILQCILQSSSLPIR